MSVIEELKTVEPFCQLENSALEALATGIKECNLPPNQYFLEVTDEGTAPLYFILQGIVELTRPASNGEDVVVDYRHEGTFVDLAPLLGEKPHTAARSASPLKALEIEGTALNDAAQANPAFFMALLRNQRQQADHLYSEIVQRQDHHAVTRIDSFPFRRRLSEIMTTPPDTCRTDDTAGEVALAMSRKHVRAMSVISGDGRLIGIVTAMDILGKALALGPREWSMVPVGKLMTPHPISLSPQTFMFEAMAYMVDHRVRQIPVVEDGVPVGMVTLAALMGYRSQQTIVAAGRARDAKDLDALRLIRQEMLPIADSLLADSQHASEVMEVLTHVHHSIIRRTYELCMEKRIQEGNSPPEAEVCFLLMGSGGRREMLLGPDQDHGLVYEDVSDEMFEELEAWYGDFGEELSQALASVGYPLCEGNVMSSNPAWRGRLKDWQDRIVNWMSNPEPQKVRDTTIFLDFVPLIGNPSFAHQLQEVVRLAVKEFPGFLFQMMELDLSHKVPLGFFGRFLPEKTGEGAGKVSLKRSGSIFLVDCIRMYSLEEQVPALTTLDRLEALVRRNIFTPDTAEQIRMAFEALAFLRVRQEVANLNHQEPLTHYVDPSALSRSERDLLRSAFRVVDKLQQMTKRHFGKSI